MLILVGFAQKGELWQQVMPISHRYARLRPPCAAFVWAVHLTVLTADYNLPQSLCPPIKSGPGISQPILMLLSIWRGSQCPEASYPGIQRTQSPKQRWHTCRHLWYIFRLFMPPPVPQIKMAPATSSWWLCLRLLKPIMRIAMPTKWVKSYVIQCRSPHGWLIGLTSNTTNNNSVVRIFVYVKLLKSNQLRERQLFSYPCCLHIKPSFLPNDVITSHQYTQCPSWFFILDRYQYVLYYQLCGHTLETENQKMLGKCSR